MMRRWLGLTSVREKLFAGVLFTSLVALLVSGAALFLYDLHSYRKASATALAVEAELLGHATSAALQFDDRSLAARNLAFLRARPTIRTAAIYNARGGMFASYVRRGVSTNEIPAGPRHAAVSIDGDRVAVFHTVAAEDELLGTVYLMEDLELEKRVVNYAAIALAVTFAAMVVAAWLAGWLQSAITRPIIEISNLAREVVERRDYALRATRTTEDETGVLVDSFNEMLAEIQRRTEAMQASSAEVSRLNMDLERRVSERTAQLEESNLQLSQANLAKSNFLSMMSHEIRTPMNGVLGMLELLSLGSLDPRQRTTLQIVRESGRSLLRIIDDILDFSKIEAGKLEVCGEVASVSRVIETVVGIYSGNASSKGLTLRSSVDARISPAVLVDPLRLQQILNNLVSNAIKFTSTGYVQLSAELVERGDDTEVVRFSVADSGIGISQEAQAALFQPFVQADAAIARAFGGTGLGLSIAKRLADLMEGTMTIASRPGEGTTVNLTLPLRIADPKLLPPDAAAHPDDLDASIARRDAPSVAQARQEGTLVLVVDDHPINRLLLAQQVTVLGYASEHAANGREAFELWETGRFSLVITDCNMPELDGYGLARAIRSEEQRTGRARTPVIACTANALKGEAENCFAAGMDDYVAKPVELVALLAKLNAWLPLPGSARAASVARPDSAAAPAEASREQVVFDASVIEEISGGDAAIEREVFAQFLPVNEQDVAALGRALDDRDLAGVTHLSHRIKGAGNAVGALALAAVCARIEAAARAKDWSRVFADRAAFEREVARLNEYLRQRAAATARAGAR